MIGLFCATPALDSTGASLSQQLHCPRQSLCVSCGRQAYLRRSRSFLRGNRIPLKRSTQRLGSRRGSKQCHAMGPKSLQVHGVWRGPGPCPLKQRVTSPQDPKVSAARHPCNCLRSLIAIRSSPKLRVWQRYGSLLWKSA